MVSSLFCGGKWTFDPSGCSHAEGHAGVGDSNGVEGLSDRLGIFMDRWEPLFPTKKTMDHSEPPVFLLTGCLDDGREEKKMTPDFLVSTSELFFCSESTCDVMSIWDPARKPHVSDVLTVPWVNNPGITIP